MAAVKSVKVLVVEDNALILDLLMKGLGPHCEASAAADGGDALMKVVDDPGRLAEFEEKKYLIVGDVDPVSVSRVAGKLSPVPGGVGPLTIAMLIHNTVCAARLRQRHPS